MIQSPTWDVPVVATFVGIRGVPTLALAHNNAAPLLRLDEGGVVYRVLRKRRRAHAEVACVDYRRNPLGRMLELTFRSGLFTFVANIADDASAARCVALLHAAGCPLSDRAADLRAQGPDGKEQS